jgi:phosphate:Na+ symporter
MVMMILATAGGLALFLYGLRVLSDGLKRVAGERIRSFLERITGRAYRGAMVGALSSGILQSSSMTMVLLIGLINAGVLTLAQGIGVMLGAEIGTTVTAQLIAFKIGHYYLPVIAIGFIMYETFRGKKTGDIGQIILGFGLLFMGMSVASTSLGQLAEAPAVLHLLRNCGTNPLLGVLIGTGVTAIIQSSSAMTALIIAMGSTGILTLPAAIALIFGANIGTTITALIASIGSSLSSRRLAIAQLVVNILGVTIFLLFISPYSNIVAATAGNLPRQIANAHSIFNVTVTLVLLPCVGGLVWLTKKIVPGREAKVHLTPRSLGAEFLNTPSIALKQAQSELLRMGTMAEVMLDSCRTVFLEGSIRHVATVLETEEAVDSLEKAIDSFLDRIDVSKLNTVNKKRLHMFDHVINDIERVGDHAVNIAERGQVMIKRGFSFSQQAQDELDNMFKKASWLYNLSIQALTTEEEQPARDALDLEKEVDQLEIRYKKHHIERLEKGVCNQTAGIIFVEVLRNLERIGDHAVNIAGDTLAIHQ